MTEQDRKTVEEAKEPRNWGEYSVCLTQDLLAIIDRLDNELTEMREAGESIEIFTDHIEPHREDDEIIAVTRLQSDRECAGDLGVKYLNVGQIRRLAEALKKVIETSEIHDSRESGVPMDLDRTEEQCRKMTVDSKAPRVGWQHQSYQTIANLTRRNAARLALLERWVKEFPSPVCAGRGTSKFWDQQKVIDNTKTLLKEAKEARDE